MASSDPSEVKLAVYAERLDRYIETQAALNKSLVVGYNNIQNEVEDIQVWRSKIYGIKTAFVAVGFLVVHLTLIIGSLAGISWVNTK
jgi:hypothetical protein|tara:strand:+ start:68 stop:328 length:261 start_codon:yes stop_codon:yes gene_type:complete